MIKNLEFEKKDLECKNKDLKTRYIIQESLYKINKINSDSLQKELLLLHDLLKNDVLNMINHLGNLEQNQNALQIKENNPCELLNLDLFNFQKFLALFDQEQVQKTAVLGKMGGLIKAMLQGIKQDAFTQVQDGELEWNIQKIQSFQENNSVFQASFFEGEVSSINYLKSQNKIPLDQNNMTNQEILKIKESEFQQKNKNTENTNINENWNLTINFIVFIENISKNNESGRVMQWKTFKNLIFDIYQQRIQYQNEINTSLISHSMPFDEFVCIFFLQKHKIRKIAEGKIFELLVSLRFYIKNQTRALYFSLLCNLTKYYYNSNENSNKFDIFAQNFFFFTFKIIMKYKNNIIEYQENEYFQLNILTLIIDEIISFFQENIKQKTLQKLQKFYIQQETQEIIEIDKILEVIMEEYFELKKKNYRNITKQFSKVYENENGVFSLDNITQIIKESYYNVQKVTKKYTFPSIFTHTRVFLRALTSTHNKFDVTPKEFLQAVQKYGLDCPFPFVFIPEDQQYQNEGNIKKQNSDLDDDTNNENYDPFLLEATAFQEFSKVFSSQNNQIGHKLQHFIQNFSQNTTKNSMQEIGLLVACEYVSREWDI
ncbi:hypothetical protein IMG5_191360 [Ichthyophthirius multifiliis]|uniref:Uncharacterized protein n=1 Tax=Ichthyophthirius multifiliis TaxID=5932 RepID=G0R4D2_ICHMU|nr:hypothetical protein IMG5_191360 [Ichthyophthirius multifiliis]EGR27670.1 hypothetical protein IMG5_191360 [Ichthyophthirius multifiliis]|eukprot:XP_004025122.1 hypothetical protein IMG5_191360 [Ichthyophthirius multifiliis]